MRTLYHMGILNRNDDQISKRARLLINNAKHSSINGERLEKLKPNRLMRYLNDRALIEYLYEDEQPHIFMLIASETPTANGPNSPTIPVHSGNGMILYLITDQRWLTVISNKDKGDQALDIPLDDILAIRKNMSKRRNHKITVGIREGIIEFPIGNKFDEETHTSFEYIRSKIPENNVEEYIDGVEINTTEKENLEEDTFTENSDSESAVEETSSNSDSDNDSIIGREKVQELVDNAVGDIEKKDVNAIKHHLDSNEQPHHVVKGVSISIEGGHSQDRKGSLTGTVRTAITDRRVLTVIPQKIMGEDTKSVPYEDIGGVDLNKGLVNKYLKFQSYGRTYKIHTNDIETGKKSRDYIRQRKREINEENQPSDKSRIDPTEQLKNLKELYKEDMLTEDEFEEKKSDLLDKI